MLLILVLAVVVLLIPPLRQLACVIIGGAISVGFILGLYTLLFMVRG